MTAPSTLVLQAVTVRFGAVAAVNEVDISFAPGEITGLIGPNGAGKTTLLNAISGFTTVTSGSITLDGVDVTARPARRRVEDGIVRGFQTVRLLDRETMFDNVLVGCERLPQPGLAAQFLNLPSQAGARRRDIAAVWTVLEALGIAGDARRLVSELPFASRRLTEIARLLLVRPKVLLLDEPAAGLDAAERRKLVEVLQAYHAENPFTFVVIEHDVDLVRRLCAHGVALDAGRVIATGRPADVLADERVQTAYFGQGHHA